MYIAHINAKEDYQSCREYCVSTAHIAEDKLTSIGLGKTAFLSGILHDAGKYSQEYCFYPYCIQSLPLRGEWIEIDHGGRS